MTVMDTSQLRLLPTKWEWVARAPNLHNRAGEVPLSVMAFGESICQDPWGYKQTQTIMPYGHMKSGSRRGHNADVPRHNAVVRNMHFFALSATG
jgi:hypothetical protein